MKGKFSRSNANIQACNNTNRSCVTVAICPIRSSLFLFKNKIVKCVCAKVIMTHRLKSGLLVSR